MVKTFIIAEAGVNHNGDIVIAKEMIDIASYAGADAIKFQTFKAHTLVSMLTKKAEYQKNTTKFSESHFEMIKRLELNYDDHKELFNYCYKKSIQFLSSPFDVESIEFLDRLGLDTMKIPSGEITNIPYLRKIGGIGKKVIISTGMSDMKEIGNALEVLTLAGMSKDDIIVLHCNSEYPTPFEDVNLKAMHTIRDSFNVKVGYSDHTLGIDVPIAAVALGAVLIEKHFTIDKTMFGPDHSASLDPDELSAMILSVRKIEKALGTGLKTASPSELKNRSIARKSIFAAQDIKAGDVFTDENLIGKRPYTGIGIENWDKILGRQAKRDFFVDEMIEI
ncbi:N-acetylneuraminate synthase [Candidatus Magnetobacterium bavaricum]|uniref:N-acetylneuraminate synthase n=1 Tax=Candidatus Magnetobacterium bavaricum TaxID=29290 RepID=A0A0F3GHF1_9BACT|nr:N-acetylneuraminate synthase [Candidatus Magnetobacterium bavaricum]